MRQPAGATRGLGCGIRLHPHCLGGALADSSCTRRSHLRWSLRTTTAVASQAGTAPSWLGRSPCGLSCRGGSSCVGSGSNSSDSCCGIGCGSSGDKSSGGSGKNGLCPRGLGCALTRLVQSRGRTLQRAAALGRVVLRGQSQGRSLQRAAARG
jgi:hypothetical protein